MYAQTIIIIILIVMELDHSLISVSCLGIHKAPPVNHKIRYYRLFVRFRISIFHGYSSGQAKYGQGRGYNLTAAGQRSNQHLENFCFTGSSPSAMHYLLEFMGDLAKRHL